MVVVGRPVVAGAPEGGEAAGRVGQLVAEDAQGFVCETEARGEDAVLVLAEGVALLVGERGVTVGGDAGAAL